MPLLISQDRIITRPGQSMQATIWVENDLPQTATFELRLRPADPNIDKIKDWYTVNVTPHSQRVDSQHRQPFTVTITPSRSPDGKTRLVEFMVEAVPARAGGGGFGPGAAPQPAPKPREDAGWMQQALLGALGGGGGGSSAPAGNGGSAHHDSGSDMLSDIVLGVTDEPDPEPVAPVTVAAVEPAPSQVREDLPQPVIALREHQSARVGIRKASRGAATATQTEQQAQQAAGGMVGQAFTGSIFLYVPPIPTFALDIVPYQPAGKKKAAPAASDKAPLVSGRVQGQFTVRVTNQEQFPATFRLESRGDDGAHYHVQEQLLRVNPGASEETVLTAAPHSLNWWAFWRSYGFDVTTTPLTGSHDIDASATRERRGVFKQLSAWLHPAPLLALLLATLLLLSLIGKPNVKLDATDQIVLREPFDLTRVQDPEAAKAAIKELRVGDDGRVMLDWSASRARDLKLEFSTKPEGPWEPVANQEEAIKEPGLKLKNSGYFRVQATGWLPWLKNTSNSVWIRMAPQAINPLRFRTPVVNPQQDTEGGTEMRAYQRLFNAGATDNELYLVQTAVSNKDEFFKTNQPQEPTSVFRAQTKGVLWIYGYRPQAGGTHSTWVTVITNAKNGNVQQFRIESPQ